MKVATLSLLLLFVIILLVPARKAATFQQPSKSAELQRLEDQLRDLDRESAGAKVTVDPSNEEDLSEEVNVVIEKTEVVAVFPSLGGSKSITTRTTGKIDLGIDVPDEYINQRFTPTFLSGATKCPGAKIMQLGATPYYDVVEDYTYDGGTFKITAWKNFRFDRASIPRIFWVLIDKDSLSNVAPLIHDLLYSHTGELPQDRVAPTNKKFSRLEADNIFKELMTKCGVGAVRRELAYQAVRNFAGSSWKKRVGP